jgi:hypothetical protein
MPPMSGVEFPAQRMRQTKRHLQVAQYLALTSRNYFVAYFLPQNSLLSIQQRRFCKLAPKDQEPVQIGCGLHSFSEIFSD